MLGSQLDMEEALDHVVYSRNVMEFVTVANEYCTLIESAPNYSRFEFVTIITRVLPLIYLKASLLPLVEQELDDSIEKSVDEMSYLLVREALNSKFGRFSDYLEVFTEDMKHSDTTVIAFIPEDLTDIYQDLKDFVEAYRLGVTEIMNDALADLVTNFREFWGQRLVNTLRALHSLLYSEDGLGDDDEEQEEDAPQKKKNNNWLDARFNGGSDVDED